MSKLEFLNGEKLNDFIYRIGDLKTSGKTTATWKDVEDSITKKFDGIKIISGNACAKRYRAHAGRNAEEIEKVNEMYSEDDIDRTIPDQSEAVEYIREDVVAKSERAAMNKLKRFIGNEAEFESQLLALIKAYEPRPIKEFIYNETDKAVYAMVSDIHYGLCYESTNPLIGRFNCEEARKRFKTYAAEIIERAKTEKADTCYVSLMGDLVHGSIHSVNMMESEIPESTQVAEMTAILSEFLMDLAPNFKTVYTNCVGGNHSRTTQNIKDCKHDDRYDFTIYKIIKMFCVNQTNIKFADNTVSPEVGNFNIFGKNYYCVHGDYDKDCQTAAARIGSLTRDHVDVLLAGHFHSPSMTFSSLTFVQNGAMCGSGDEYATSKKLFTPASQVFLVADKTGVRDMRIVTF